MSESMNSFERPLAEREAATLLGVSPNTLKHWRWIGKGPRYVKLVGKVAYRPADLREWVDSNVSEPGLPA